MDTHALDVGGVGNRRFEQLRMGGTQVVHEPSMQPFMAINHREETKNLELANHVGVFFDETIELFVGAQRQCRGNGWYEQSIGCTKHAFRCQRNTRRTIKKDIVVLLGNLTKRTTDTNKRLLRIIKPQVEMAIGKVSRNKVEIVEVGGFDGIAEFN